MLRTALRPKWLALLVVALVTCGLFAALSWWQLNSAFSSARAPVDADEYQREVPLGQLLEPGVGVTEEAAGRMIVAEGWLDGRDTVVVEGRLQDGAEGYWLMARLIVADAAPVAGVAIDTPETVAGMHPSIPVALGWVADRGRAHEVAADLAEIAPPSADDAETISVVAQLQPPSEPRPARKADDPQTVLTLAPGQLINLWSEPSPGYYSATLVSASITPELSLPNDVEAIALVGVDQSLQLNLLNIFYAIEWVIFIGMALYIWWRLVRDEYLAERAAVAEAPDRLAAEIRREKLLKIAAQRAEATDRKDES
ncbi:hypothetical protein PV375_01970 [Gulosibacter sp. GYB002]|uniref:SURF1 family cytochrome oxidase biogenesis protein n=1 Tax=Gulosibacter sp. GYB002 TaxID=2994391 RepID=UPI002F968CD7